MYIDVFVCIEKMVYIKLLVGSVFRSRIGGGEICYFYLMYFYIVLGFFFFNNYGLFL